MRTEDSRRMKPARLIYLTGIDGSRKTALAQDLVRHLAARGDDVRYVHGVMRGNLLLGPVRRLARTLFLRGANVHHDYPAYRTTMVSASRRHRHLSALYGLVWFVNYLVEAFVPITFQTLRGRTVVADRYVYDIILRIALATDRPATGFTRLLRLFFWMNARPDASFLVDMPEEQALKIKADVHSLEYLRERRVGYQELARRYGFRVLDGREAPDQLLATVLSRLTD